MTDTGLAHLRGLADLESLMLRGCTGFSDAGLVHLEGMVGLKELYLDQAKVTDAGLAHLRGMSRLETLGLDHAEVTDAGLVHLEGMSRLRFLNLRGTRVTDAGLTRLQALKGLHSLNLEGSEVTDAGLVHSEGSCPRHGTLARRSEDHRCRAGALGEMSGLTTLGLDHAMITDAGLVHLERLTGLQKLSLSGTQVTDNGLVMSQGVDRPPAPFPVRRDPRHPRGGATTPEGSAEPEDRLLIGRLSHWLQVAIGASAGVRTPSSRPSPIASPGRPKRKSELEVRRSSRAIRGASDDV